MEAAEWSGERQRADQDVVRLFLICVGFVDPELGVGGPGTADARHIVPLHDDSQRDLVETQGESGSGLRGRSEDSERTKITGLVNGMFVGGLEKC